MPSNADGPFGAVLRRQRRAAGLTQEELAARAGLSARGIADLERGVRHTPRRATIEMLVGALGGTEEVEAVLFAAAHRSLAPGNQPVRTTADSAAASASDGHVRDEPPHLPRHNLPAQVTRLLGREEAVREVTALARRADVRLVTLTGPGGVGKTRLAIEVAAELLDDFADGVWFVRLSRLVDPALVVPTIAETLGLKEAGDQPIAATLRAHLREKRLLLVLDNCEHVAAAMPAVAELLEAAPALKVLATSRAALRLRGEHESPLPPLALPPAALGPGTAPGAGLALERLTDYPAVALFVERARAVSPDFALTTVNASMVTAICAGLDGLPLAIELAAARVKLLPPAALLARLGHSTAFLAGGARDLEERQQAMRGTIAWSENLLAPAERVLFRRLAVFSGGCTLEAARAVCAAPEEATPLGVDVLDGLGALVEQSLLQQREEGGEPRFGMLHVIREYALERLETLGAADESVWATEVSQISSGGRPEAEALRQAHATWALDLAERAEPELVGPEAAVWLDRLEREHDNLRTALTWARERGEVATGLRIVAAIFRFWMARGHLREGRAWAEDMLALKDSAAGAVRARVLRAAGVLALYQGEEAAAATRLEEAATLGRDAGDLLTAAGALSSLGVAAMQLGEFESAAARHEESLALMRVVGERRGIAVVLTNLGIVVYQQGDLGRAASAFAEALAFARQADDRDLIATSLANLASVALRRGDVGAGEELGREALALYRDLGDPRRCAVGLEGLANSAGMAGQGVRAARLLGAAAALREPLGSPPAPGEREDTEQAVASARADIGDERWAAAFASGRALSLEAAVAEALGEV